MQLHQAARSSRGFTLVELMVVVVIATMLLAIAVPSYMSQIRQSRRTEARTAILDLAGREERYLSTNPAGYTNVPALLGYPGFGAANPVASGYYYLSVCSPACAPSLVAAPSYTITALPVAGQSQIKDTQCASFSVDSTGKQFASNSAGADSTAYCWAN
jgi:type IV pilus assembly protein PilE